LLLNTSLVSRIAERLFAPAESLHAPHLPDIEVALRSCDDIAAPGNGGYAGEPAWQWARPVHAFDRFRVAV